MNSCATDKTAALTLHRVEISGHLNLDNAGELRERLVCLLGDASPIELDMTRADSVDSSVLQLLCALRRSAVSRGISLSFKLDKKGILSNTASELGFHRSGNCVSADLWGASSCNVEGDRI